MRGIALLALAPAFTSLIYASNSGATEMVSVAQLEQIVAQAGTERDGAIAKRISETRLIERLSGARLAKLEKELPGHQSREALQAVADESAFLSLPASDLPDEAPPDAARQAAMLAQAADHFRATTAAWPSFTALRFTSRFEGTATVIPGGLQDDLRMPGAARWLAPTAGQWECPGHPKFDHRRLSVIERSTITIIHRGGSILHSMNAAGEFACTQSGMNTADDIAETILIVPILLSGNHAGWSHWENGTDGPIAVFHYAIKVSYSKPGGVGDHPSNVDLRGELSVRPGDGALVRLTEVRRWVEDQVPKEYDTAMEFARIAMDGREFMFPCRRTALFLVPVLRPRDSGGGVERAYRKYHLDASPLQEYLNDVTFSDYRPYIPPPENAGSRASLQ